MDDGWRPSGKPPPAVIAGKLPEDIPIKVILVPAPAERVKSLVHGWCTFHLGFTWLAYHGMSGTLLE